MGVGPHSSQNPVCSLMLKLFLRPASFDVTVLARNFVTKVLKRPGRAERGRIAVRRRNGEPDRPKVGRNTDGTKDRVRRRVGASDIVEDVAQAPKMEERTGFQQAVKGRPQRLHPDYLQPLHSQQKTQPRQMQTSQHKPPLNSEKQLQARQNQWQRKQTKDQMPKELSFLELQRQQSRDQLKPWQQGQWQNKMRPEGPKIRPNHRSSSELKKNPPQPTQPPVVKVSKPVPIKPPCTRTDELQCPHYSICSGCTMRGDFTDTPKVNRAKEFFSGENVNFSVHIGPHKGYRTYAKLAVQPASGWGGLKFGLYGKGTHEVDDIPSCVVQHPRINEAVAMVKKLAGNVGVKSYQDGTPGNANSVRARDHFGLVVDAAAASAGELRYIQCSYDEESDTVALVLVWNAASLEDCSPALSNLVEQLSANTELFHSVSVNFNTSTNNSIVNIRRNAWKTLWGKAVFPQRVGDATFYFKPQIFRQANMSVFGSQIVPKIVSYVPTGSTVTELYSGIGLIGINVAQKAKTVLCFDSNSVVEEVFKRGSRSLENEADHDKCSYAVLGAREAVEQNQCEHADLLIVDPPRKGLDLAVMQLLLGAHPKAVAPQLKTLIYVSCGFHSFEKDARALLDSGKWVLRSADGYVIFPGSDHIETVAVFDTVSSNEIVE